MQEVIFDIPTIKKLYPELNRCFGFTYDDISNELTQVYAQKVFNLTQEEKELANQCKSENGWGVDAIKFALATNENIVVTVPENFNPATIMNSYVTGIPAPICPFFPIGRNSMKYLESIFLLSSYFEAMMAAFGTIIFCMFLVSSFISFINYR